MKTNTNINLSQVFAFGLEILLTNMLFGSCTSSEELPSDTPNQEVAASVNLALGVSGGMASRELNTWDAAQQVNDMRIYIFRCAQDKMGTADEAFTYYIPSDLANTDKGYYTVSEFANQTPYYSAQHNNQMEQHTYSFIPFLESGYYYQFLAIGRDDKYAETKVLTEPSLTAETTTLEDASIALTSAAQEAAQDGSPLTCTEFFSGILQDEQTKAETPILVTDHTKHFERTLTATRNVAGLMLYVQNIPSVVEDNTTTASTPETFTPTSLSIEVTGIAATQLLKSKTPLDSDTPLSYQKLATIDLTTDNGWIIDKTQQIFTRAANTDKGWKENSYLVSNFMMPTPATDMGKSKNADQKETTFYLHYTDGTHHRYDNVKLAVENGYEMKFPIQANHLYSIGAKSSTTNEPYDLKKYYEPVMVDLTIEIEPSFEKKHEFETK